MIEKPTVLILGAGASNHVGFPLGNGLKNEICNRIDSIIKFLYDPKNNPEPYILLKNERPADSTFLRYVDRYLSTDIDEIEKFKQFAEKIRAAIC